MFRSDLMDLRSQDSSERIVEEVSRAIHDEPDYPKEGIIFHDIISAWVDSAAFRASCDGIHLLAMEVSGRINKIVGIEARGWPYAAVLADRLGKGFVGIRKSGRHLTGPQTWRSYGIEYGEGTITMQKSAIKRGDSVIIVDDLIATGGSDLAAIDMIEELGGSVERIIAVSDLAAEPGRIRLEQKGYDVKTIFTYPGK